MTDQEFEIARRALQRALDAVGGNQSELARRIGTRQQYVHRMFAGRGVCKPEFVLAVERATGVPRHELRPDLYPREEAA